MTDHFLRSALSADNMGPWMSCRSLVTTEPVNDTAWTMVTDGSLVTLVRKLHVVLDELTVLTVLAVSRVMTVVTVMVVMSLRLHDVRVLIVPLPSCQTTGLTWRCTDERLSCKKDCGELRKEHCR